jgi:hypothetical protein
MTQVDDTAKQGLLRKKDTEPYPSPAGSPTSQFEPANLAAVAGGKKGQSQHAGAPDGSGPGPSFAFAKESRGIHEKSSMFAAQKGNSPTRSAGKSTAKDVDGGRLE